MRSLLATVAVLLLVSACEIYADGGPSPGVDAGLEVDAVELDATAPDADAAPRVCAEACPTQYECVGYECACVGPLVPAGPCLGSCAEVCGDAGWIEDETTGVWSCDLPFTPHRCAG